MNFQMKEKERKVGLVFLLLILSLLLIGCTPNPIIIERNITTYINRTINNTIYINDTVLCNITEPIINTTIYDRDYVLGLIRQLKKYENQQDLYLNNSDCYDDLNRTETKLDICEDVMCREWNSSWC